MPFLYINSISKNSWFQHSGYVCLRIELLVIGPLLWKFDFGTIFVYLVQRTDKKVIGIECNTSQEGKWLPSGDGKLNRSVKQSQEKPSTVLCAFRKHDRVGIIMMIWDFQHTLSLSYVQISWQAYITFQKLFSCV